MLRTMVFIDYQNFNINLQTHYYKSKKKMDFKSINYHALAKEINKILHFESQVVKTYLFAYKPNEQLMRLDKYKRYYKWLTNMKKTPYFEIIEGRQEIRTINGVKFDVNNQNTYTTEEKETDINLATHMLAKGFQNAYDIAVLVSGDTDYIKVVETLHNIGKTVVIAHFKHQIISKYDGIIDSNIILFDNLLNNASNQKLKAEKNIETSKNCNTEEQISNEISMD